jgi:hypothetical protein
MLHRAEPAPYGLPAATGPDQDCGCASRLELSKRRVAHGMLRSTSRFDSREPCLFSFKRHQRALNTSNVPIDRADRSIRLPPCNAPLATPRSCAPRRWRSRRVPPARLSCPTPCGYAIPLLQAAKAPRPHVCLHQVTIAGFNNQIPRHACGLFRPRRPRAGGWDEPRRRAAPTTSHQLDQLVP